MSGETAMGKRFRMIGLEQHSEPADSPRAEREFRLSNLLLKKHQVEGFVDLGLEDWIVGLVNEVYGVALKVPKRKNSNEASLVMKGRDQGVLTFTLGSLLRPPKNGPDAISESQAEYVANTFEDFLNTRRYNVTTMSSWANGNNPMFYEEIFENEKFWGPEPKYPHFKFESFFSPKIVTEDCFLGKKFILNNAHGPNEALWAARLFLDKVCLPIGIFLSAKVKQEVDAHLASGSVNVTKKKPTIEFLPFSDSRGGVLCETMFDAS